MLRYYISILLIFSGKSWASDFFQEEVSPECLICLEKIENKTSLYEQSGGYFFHCQCKCDWFSANQNGCCPLDSDKIYSDFYVNAYIAIYGDEKIKKKSLSRLRCLVKEKKISLIINEDDYVVFSKLITSESEELKKLALEILLDFCLNSTESKKYLKLVDKNIFSYFIDRSREKGFCSNNIILFLNKFMSYDKEKLKELFADELVDPLLAIIPSCSSLSQHSCLVILSFLIKGDFSLQKTFLSSHNFDKIFDLILSKDKRVKHQTACFLLLFCGSRNKDDTIEKNVEQLIFDGQYQHLIKKFVDALKKSLSQNLLIAESKNLQRTLFVISNIARRNKTFSRIFVQEEGFRQKNGHVNLKIEDLKREKPLIFVSDIMSCFESDDQDLKYAAQDTLYSLLGIDKTSFTYESFVDDFIEFFNQHISSLSKSTKNLEVALDFFILILSKNPDILNQVSALSEDKLFSFVMYFNILNYDNNALLKMQFFDILSFFLQHDNTKNKIKELVLEELLKIKRFESTARNRLFEMSYQTDESLALKLITPTRRFCCYFCCF